MKRHVYGLTALLLGVITAAGCTGGNPNYGVLPLNDRSSALQARTDVRTNVTLRIRIRKHVRPKYVSPATVSATISIAPKAGCTTCSDAKTVKVALTPSSPNCSATPAALTCTISLALGAGLYAGTVSTYDALGIALSANQSFPVSIEAGKANAIGVTLYGVPAGVSAALVDPKRGAQSVDASGQETIDIVGGHSQAQILLTAVDADDYVIAGPGAPKMTFAISGSNGFSAAATPGLPNVATITTPSVRTAGTDKLLIILSGPECGEPAADCATSVDLGLDAVVATAAANDTVEIQTLQGTVLSTISLEGGSSPTSLAFDSRGNLFVAGSNMAVHEFAWPYRSVPTATFGQSTFATQCPGMVIDSSNDVIVGQSNGVSMYSPPYSGAPKSQAFVDPQCLGMDAAGNLYIITAYGPGILLSVPPPFFSGTYNAVGTSGTPTSIAVDTTDDVIGVLSNGFLQEYDESLNLVKQSASPVSVNGNLTFGDGTFVASLVSFPGFVAYTESGLTYLGQTFTGSNAAVAMFDSAGDLLSANQTGISIFHPTSWNEPQRNGFVPTSSPAIVMASWP